MKDDEETLARLARVTKDVHALPIGTPHVVVTLLSGDQLTGRLTGVGGIHALDDIRGRTVGLKGSSTLQLNADGAAMEIEATDVMSVRAA